MLSILDTLRRMTNKQVNRRIMAALALSCIFAVSLAFAAEVPTPLDTAERMDRMTSVGVLSFCLVTSNILVGVLIKLQYGKMFSTLDRSAEVNAQAIESIHLAMDSTKAMLDTVRRCEDVQRLRIEQFRNSIKTD